MTILCIESATTVCSVAMGRNGEVIHLKETSRKNAHSEKLTLFIRGLSDETGIPLSSIDAVAVSRGPGSYTGLRIGVAAAKGLCYTLDKPLIAVPTLSSMAAGMKSIMDHSGLIPSKQESILFCPMIDARRMEVYTAHFDFYIRQITETEAIIVDRDSFNELLKTHFMVFGGEGADKCAGIITPANAHFLPSFSASAGYMVPLAEKRFLDGQFEHTAYFEPFYLKEFIAGKPVVKGLRD